MADKTPAQVIPNIFVESVDDSRSYFIDKLGFNHMMGMVGKDGRLDFCIVEHGGAMIMIARPASGAAPAPSAELYIEVGDPDAYHGEVAGNGVAVVDALATQWWGDRNFSVQEPHGYKVWFYKTVAEFDPGAVPAGVKVI